MCSPYEPVAPPCGINGNLTTLLQTYSVISKNDSHLCWVAICVCVLRHHSLCLGHLQFNENILTMNINSLMIDVFIWLCSVAMNQWPFIFTLSVIFTADSGWRTLSSEVHEAVKWRFAPRVGFRHGGWHIFLTDRNICQLESEHPRQLPTGSMRDDPDYRLMARGCSDWAPRWEPGLSIGYPIWGTP